MEEMYAHRTVEDLHGLIAAAAGGVGFDNRMSSDGYVVSIAGDEDDALREMKARIASHPRYPNLLQAYIDCQKVGAPPEIASLLDEIRRENGGRTISGFIGADPELDEFMETYCDVLVKYRSDLARPFDEATNFLNSIESQLSDLCKPAPPPSTSLPHLSEHAVFSGLPRKLLGQYSSDLFTLAIKSLPCTLESLGNTQIRDEATGSPEEEVSGGEIEAQESHLKGEDRDLKDKLLRKYSGYLSSLKQEFSKKKKIGKLPKEARQKLLDWWSAHYKWPYPTEADKIALAESTGLDQKQINNWFINQRKRHWKPSENMQFAVMDSLSTPFYVDD